MSADTSSPRFTMVGAPDALACEGDACLLPGAVVVIEPEPADIEPEPADIEPEPAEAAAASVRAVNIALDEGASL